MPAGFQTVYSRFTDCLTILVLVEQRSAAILFTTLLGACANVAGNLLLIPRWGSMGAALSTLLSYGLIFAVRAVHTRSMLRLRWSVPKLALSLGILGLQCLLMEWNVPRWPLLSALCLLAAAALHFRPLWSALRSVF